MNQQSFIYKFLLDPRFRIWRYVSLVLFFTIVSINQALVGYKDIIPAMGNKIYGIIAVTVLIYLATVYLASKVVLKYLLSGKYTKFFLCIVLCAVLFTAVSNIVFDSYMENYDFFSEIIIVDNLSAFMIYILCIPGVIIPVFLRNWMLSNQHLNELKIKRQSSQVEQLKAQINPKSFFKILNKSGMLVKTEPDKASAMLMKLSQLLRYQLYDCNREQVLLSAEISFLRNFLELEELHSPEFKFSITITGNINGIFIPPLVLLPYVQSVINAFEEKHQVRHIYILINNSEETINITLEVSGIYNGLLLEEELSIVRERLDTLYMDHYLLTVVNDKPAIETEIVLKLDKK